MISLLAQWNLDLTKCQGTGEICSLYRAFVLYRTPPFNEFYGKLLKCSSYRGIVKNLIYKTQHFRIWKITVITFQYRAIHSYGIRNSRTGTVHINFILFVLFGFFLSHADIYSLNRGIFCIWASAIVFVITRISLKGSVPYILLSVILAELNKIFRCTEDFVI